MAPAEDPDVEVHLQWWPAARGFAPGTGDEYFVQLHELLLALAGRLPDADLVSLRRSVVTDLAVVPEATVVSALDAGVALTRPEVNAVVEISRAFGVPGGETPRLARLALIDAVPDDPRRFTARPGVPQDFTDVSAAASLKYERGPLRIWRAWRADAGGPRRVYLAEVAPATEAWLLTDRFQQDLAKLIAARPAEAGDVVPTVEIFWAGWEHGPYQRRALETGELLWSRDGGAA
ncbi:hypothetical protein [Dactylosporangium sp. CS-033363]|uniref:hypothetical protein n=1 Tax=Dactylosporangium sp. CS-033363 TaxID=3239935 RepID=UPI003D93B77D